MRLVTIGALAAALAAPPAFAQETAPYVGVWDCQVATFTFTRDTYNNGSELLPIDKIERDGDTFVLTFADAYQVGLSLEGETRMSWLSLATGDGFECTRLYY